MRKRQKGSLTIFLALTSLMFLTFFLVLIEGSRNYQIRAEAEQAMELAQFSVLSEYQKELFEHYGVFFLDLDYEQGAEYQAVLENRAENYLTRNAEETQTQSVTAGKFRRATDGQGSAFFSQAVELMKVKSGYKLFEELLEQVGGRTEETVDLETLIEEQKSAAEGNLGDETDEEGEEHVQISLPSVSFPSVGALREAVLGSDAGLSRKSIDLSERLMTRELERGAGSTETAGFADMQLFHSYLFKYYPHYGTETDSQWTECLQYQMEYIIAGKSSDFENLENIMWRIFLLRASGNYLFFHQDAAKMQSAQAQATAIAGITGNAALINAVRELILLAQAVEEGISETKRVFAGEKVPLYEQGIFAGTRFGYEEYLGLFLNTTGQKEKVYRCMDIAELEVREKCGYAKLRLDHCVDQFELKWSYQFDSLFFGIPFLDGNTYETTITRKVYYET